MGLRLSEGLDLGRLVAVSGLRPGNARCERSDGSRPDRALRGGRLRASRSGRIVLNEVVLRLAIALEPADADLARRQSTKLRTERGSAEAEPGCRWAAGGAEARSGIDDAGAEFLHLQDGERRGRCCRRRSSRKAPSTPVKPLAPGQLRRSCSAARPRLPTARSPGSPRRGRGWLCAAATARSSWRTSARNRSSRADRAPDTRPRPGAPRGRRWDSPCRRCRSASPSPCRCRPAAAAAPPAPRSPGRPAGTAHRPAARRPRRPGWPR